MRSCYVYVDCCTLRHKPHENVAWLANSAAVPYSSTLTMSYPGEIRKTCAKGLIWHHVCSRSSARNLSHHVLADVKRKGQQARIRAQRYREIHEDQRQAIDATRRHMQKIQPFSYICIVHASKVYRIAGNFRGCRFS